LQAAELAGPKRDKGVLGYGRRKNIEFIDYRKNYEFSVGLLYNVFDDCVEWA